MGRKRIRNISRKARGFPREDGKKRTCIRRGCGKMATTRYERITPGGNGNLILTVHACTDHGREAGAY